MRYLPMHSSTMYREEIQGWTDLSCQSVILRAGHYYPSFSLEMHRRQHSSSPYNFLQCDWYSFDGRFVAFRSTFRMAPSGAAHSLRLKT